jgi:hypothetical protein
VQAVGDPGIVAAPDEPWRGIVVAGVDDIVQMIVEHVELGRVRVAVQKEMCSGSTARMALVSRW